MKTTIPACQNTSTRGTGIGGIPQCYHGKGHVKLLIVYGQGPDDERDTLDLCYECSQAVIKDAESHNYFTKILEIVPVVGLGATVAIGSDCSPYTVANVISDKKIILQADDYKCTDYHAQKYSITRNGNAQGEVWTLRSDGAWRRQGSTKGSGFRLALGHRRAYRDPSF